MTCPKRFALVLVILAAFGCAGTPEPPRDWEDFPRVDGSTSAQPLLAAVLCRVFGLRTRWYEGIVREDYPLATEVYLVTRADEPGGGPVDRLRRWMLGPDGQEAVRESGYAPVR